MQASRRFRISAAEAEAALDGLVKAGAGRWVEAGSGPAGGRPTMVFELTEGGNGNTTSGNPERDEVVLPLRPDNEAETQSGDASDGETEWTG